MTANLHHVVLTVRDIEASVGWYTDLFGFAELAREEHFGGSGRPDGPPRRSGLVHGRRPRLPPRERRGDIRSEPDRARPRGSLTVADRATLEEWEARMSDKGIKHSPISDHDWGSSLNFRDPDDMQLQLVAFRQS